MVIVFLYQRSVSCITKYFYAINFQSYLGLLFEHSTFSIPIFWEIILLKTHLGP